MIYVSLKQSQFIIDYLKANPDRAEELAIPELVKGAHISQETAEAYLKSWRHNHPNGAIIATRRAVEASQRIIEPAEKVIASLATHENRGAKLLEGVGKVAAIIRLYEQGYTRKQIVAAGYNQSTVNCQVGRYEKLKKQSK